MFTYKKIILIPLLCMLHEQAYSVDNIVVENDKKLARELLITMQEPYTMVKTKKIDLPRGRARYKLSQYYKKLPIWDKEIISATDDLKNIREEDLIKGSFIVNIEDDILTTEPQINEEQAISIATSGVNSPIKNINAVLTVKTYNDIATLVYVVDYFIDTPKPTRPYFVIDANTGQILETWDGLTTE